MRRAALLLLLALTLAFVARAEPSAEQRFADGLAALERGAVDAAIDHFEALADRGFVHPDASYNRAAAYVARARSSARKPGDLGRAAAALAETLELRPGDADAERALEAVRAEIARRRARQGGDPMAARPSLGRAVVGLLPEAVWLWAAVLGAVVCTIGLIVRLTSSARRPRLGGTIAASIGAGVLLLTGTLTYAARSLRLGSEPAVVVVPEARLLDEHGRPIPTPRADDAIIPEGASVHVLERGANLFKVEWGSSEGWLAAGQVRLLAKPEG